MRKSDIIHVLLYQVGENMIVKNNIDLVNAVNGAIAESGYKKSYIAEKIGISRQAFTNFMNKSNFSLDDANKILSIIGYETMTEIHKKYE